MWKGREGSKGRGDKMKGGVGGCVCVEGEGKEGGRRERGGGIEDDNW